MSIKNSTFRTLVSTLESGVSTIYFNDTVPNIAQIRNQGSATVWVGFNSNIDNTSNFERELRAGSTIKITRPLAFRELYFYSNGQNKIIMNTVESDEFYANDLDESLLNITITGNVTVDSLPELPEGNKNIGKVIVTDIPDIDISNLPNSFLTFLTDLINTNYIDVTFFDLVTNTQSYSIPINGKKSLLIDIYGTCTSRDISFLAKSKSGLTREIYGLNQSTNEYTKKTLGINELWYFDSIEGYEYITITINSISGGNLSIKGRMVK